MTILRFGMALALFAPTVSAQPVSSRCVVPNMGICALPKAAPLGTVCYCTFAGRPKLGKVG